MAIHERLKTNADAFHRQLSQTRLRKLSKKSISICLILQDCFPNMLKFYGDGYHFLRKLMLLLVG